MEKEWRRKEERRRGIKNREQKRWSGGEQWMREKMEEGRREKGGREEGRREKGGREDGGSKALTVQ